MIILYNKTTRKAGNHGKSKHKYKFGSTLKKNAQELLRDLGMDLTTAITIFLRQTVREQGIPFEIKREIPNAQTIEALNEYTNMKEHPENYKHYASFSDAMSEVLDA